MVNVLQCELALVNKYLIFTLALFTDETMTAFYQYIYKIPTYLFETIILIHDFSKPHS